MAGFEDLIRGALIKQGTTTPESRERVYNSARQALDRMLADETKFSPEVANAQRTKLETAISEIDAGYAKAEVTRGGVATNEVNPRSMESRLVRGLYFAGEILDIDGPIGGYNFQAAFSTGHTAGISV